MDPDEARATLETGDRAARREAARHLWRAAREPQSGLGEPTGGLEDVLEDDDPVVRGHVADVFGTLLFRTHEPEEPIPQLDALLARLTDDDPAVRQTVTGVLSNREWWYDIDAPDHPLSDDQRELAAAGLVECLGDPVAVTRNRASGELSPSLVAAHPRPEEATAAVVDALDASDAGVRSNAAEILSGIAERRPELLDPHVDRLEAMLDDDTVPTALLDGFVTLVDRHPAFAAISIRAILASEPDRTYQQARQIRSLGEALGAQPAVEQADEAVAALEEALADRNVKKRRAATWALATVAKDAPSHVAPFEPDLRECLHSFDEFMRKRAAVALGRLYEQGETALEPPLADLADVYADRSLDDSLPEPLVELAPAHPEYVTDLLERMRDETPNLHHDTRLIVAEILDTAPAAAHPFLERCAADLDAETQAVRDGAAWMLGQNVLEHPAAGARYESAIAAAVEQPEQFDDLAHRKMRKALETL